VRIDGVAVSAEDVEKLAVRLARKGAFDTSHRLLRALRKHTQALELDERDRNRLLVLLTDPPPHFQELQRVLSGGSPLRWGQLETT